MQALCDAVSVILLQLLQQADQQLLWPAFLEKTLSESTSMTESINTYTEYESACSSCQYAQCREHIYI